MVDFGTDLSITYVMGGLARQFEEPATMIVPWLDASERSGMPVDPRLWAQAPLSSSYPACMAVKAAEEQGADVAGRYLRALREGLMCFRRKLDTVEALVSEARDAGLDAARFRASLESNAIVEAFGADLEETRSVEGIVLPSVRFEGRPGSSGCSGKSAMRSGERRRHRWARLLRAAPLPDPLAAVGRFGRAATVEVATICDLPGTRASAELWGLAAELRLQPVHVLTGTLWEPAG